MRVNKTVCDLCGSEAHGSRPKGWGSIWVFFGETEETKQTSFMLDVCSIGCLVKSCPTIKGHLDAHVVRKEKSVKGGDKNGK